MDGYITIGTRVDTKGLETSLNSIEKNIDRSMKSATSSITSAFNYIKFSIVNAGINIAINEITGSLQEGISRLDTMKNYENVMSNLGIGGTEAKASIERLSEALRGLPTSLDSAALSVQRLTSANGNIQASTEMFLAMNNAILAGGASAGLQASAIEQLSQAYAKGKPDMMEWRTLMMAMPAQLTQIAKVMNYASAEALGEALRKGEVSMNEFMITLTKMNKEGLNGFKSLKEQAENATGGISTSLQNIKTALARAWADIMDAIGRENIVGFFKNIINIIDALAQRIVAIIKLIAQAINFISNLFGRKTSKKVKDVGQSSQAASSSIAVLGNDSSSASSGMDKAAKSANKLNKELRQLSGFDEMEVLKKIEQANTAGSGGAGGIGGGAEGIDYGNLQDIELGELTGNMKKAKVEADGLLNAILGLVGGLIALKNGVSPLKSFGIGTIIWGVTDAIQGLLNYLKKPDWKNFGSTIDGIGKSVLGLGAATGNLPLALAGALTLILAQLYKVWDEIKIRYDEFSKNMKGKSDGIRKVLGDNVANFYDYSIGFMDRLFNYVDTKVKNIRKLFDDLISFFRNLANGNWKQAWINIRDVFSNIWNSLPKIGMNAMVDLGIKMANAFKANFAGILNSILAKWEERFNWFISKINNAIKAINKIPGVNIEKMQSVKLPRLAKGGIVNLPGRGINYGGANIGEAGREAVLPLQDTEVLNEIADAIGRRITINAQMNNYMNGRLISRELKTIQNEDDFAFNR